MGKEMYNNNEAFYKTMDRCEAIYKVLTDGESLLDIVFNTEEEGLVT